MTTFINCTPHAINLNNGTEYAPSGDVAGVSQTFTEFNSNGVCGQVFKGVVGLPNPREGVMYIVSALILIAEPDRLDIVAPATGHPDCVRNDKGHVVSVPGFVM